MKSNNLTEEFTNTIEGKILSGEWGIGEHLPTLRELAETMGVSRSVVNAGIAKLSKSGYLKIVPRKWIEVADWKREGTLDVLIGLSREGLLKGASLNSVLQTRLLIECESVKLACENASDEAVEELFEHIEKESKAKTLEERVANDLVFHHKITLLSGNMVYPLIIKSFETIAEEFVTLFYRSDGAFETAVDIHKQICESLKNRDVSGATEAMEKLLRHGEKEIITIC